MTFLTRTESSAASGMLLEQGGAYEIGSISSPPRGTDTILLLHPRVTIRHVRKMEYIFTTDELSEGARDVCWQNEFLRVFQTDVRISRGAAAFKGQIRTRVLGTATLVNVHLLHEDDRPHVIHHDPGSEARAGRPSIYVLANLEGLSRYHYDGGSKRASPGDVLLFAVRCRPNPLALRAETKLRRQ